MSKKLMYQFTEENKLRISDICCVKMKEEGGRRTQSTCLQFRGKKLKKFQPLVPVTKAWEEWLISEYNIEICDIYNPPYNFERTGCKGCPFAINLQHELDTLEKYFPNERKQCEIIWKPVYDEYRRIGYRLKPNCGEKKEEE